MELTTILVICIIIFMIIFIPNAGEPSLWNQWVDNRSVHHMEKLAKENKGNKTFIIDMINKKIAEDNEHEMQFYNNLEDIQPYITDIDPFQKYNFHGGCHGCKVPENESIAGCYSCTYYNIWEGKDKSKLYKDN